jgi:RNA-splicing ligase RtcB
MIEVTGKYNRAICYTDELEPSAVGQITSLCDFEAFADSKIRVMPDVHAGMGCTIGTTMTITDKVVPGMVGVDIGCGMETVRLKDKRIDLPKLDSLIRSRIPSGRDVRSKVHKYATGVDLRGLRSHHDLKRAWRSIGTLGGGNHFIEIDRSDDGTLYLVVHSGSRNIGLHVAEYYQKAAYKALGGKSQSEIPYEMAYVSGELMDDYLHDMAIMQDFAYTNRVAIADEIISGMNLKEEDRMTTVHNYIDFESRILRKGAVSAKKGETLLIPINMRDGSLICTGKGNDEWNRSAPHGAGRLMSRRDAKASFTLNEFKKQMDGVFSSTVSASTLDECPMAYKGIDEIVRHIEPTAEITDHIHPIYNFKAAE